MRRLYALIISFIAFSCMAYGQTVTDQIELHSFKDVSRNNLSSKFIDDWPMDVNGEYECAWVRVRFENMTKEEARAVTFNFGNSAPLVEKRDRMDELEKEIWLFVTPTDNAIMEADAPTYGMSNRLPNIKLKEKGTYDVVLKNNKTVTINVFAKPDGATITMETGQTSASPATFYRVPLGSHKIAVIYDGVTKAVEDIEVSERNVNFAFDYRPEKEVKFTSAPAGAELYLNGAKVGVTPIKLPLRYDSYKVTASLEEYGTDTKTIEVDEDSETEIKLYPTSTPVVETLETNVRSSSRAVFRGRIASVGNPPYKERGFVYSTHPNPVIQRAAKITVEGNDTGIFRASVSDLTKGMTYYVRAYARTAKEIFYGGTGQITMSEYYDQPTFEYEGHIYRVHPGWGAGSWKWPEAIAHCKNLYYCGFSDWIVPTKEMMSVMWKQKDKIWIYPTNVLMYWTSSVVEEGSTVLGWMLDTNVGSFKKESLGAKRGIRPVRMER